MPRLRFCTLSLGSSKNKMQSLKKATCTVLFKIDSGTTVEERLSFKRLPKDVARLVLLLSLIGDVFSSS
mgnify:CR=1 FL=1